MNLALATTELQNALGDTTNAVYSNAALNIAVMRGIRAYSQWKKCLRRLGSAVLLSQAGSGATTINVTGGLLAIGQVILLDYGSSVQETVTVQALATQDDETQPTAFTAVTLTAPTAHAHGQGALILPSVGTSGQIGLTVNVGQDSYPLPLDLVDVEKSTFDMAVGAKLTWRKGNGYYDATSIIANELSGTGFGRSSNWGPQSVFSYPLVGDPFDNPNGGWPIGGSLCYRFYLSDNPYLRVIPAPTFSMILGFDYYGCHTVQSVPSSDQELILLYARYVALSARANAYQEGGTGGDVKIEEYSQSPSKNVQALRDLADAALKTWESRTRFIPYITSG